MSERRAGLDADAGARFWSGLAYATRFFMGDADVQRALLKLARLLDEARNSLRHRGGDGAQRVGDRRVTVDVHLLLTREGLDALKARAGGRGYVEKFPGSRGLRDTEHGVPSTWSLPGSTRATVGRRPSAFPIIDERAGAWR